MVKFKHEKLYAVSLWKYFVQFNPLGYYETDNEELIELMRAVGKYEEVDVNEEPAAEEPTPPAGESTSDKTVDELRAKYKEKFGVKANWNWSKAKLLEELSKEPTPPAGE